MDESHVLQTNGPKFNLAEGRSRMDDRHHPRRFGTAMIGLPTSMFSCSTNSSENRSTGRCSIGLSLTLRFEAMYATWVAARSISFSHAEDQTLTTDQNFF